MINFISFIIPVYNAERLIYQFYENISAIGCAEFIFVDDGSIDNSFDILLEIQEKDSRVKVIRQENMGPMHARNNGLLVASYNFVSFVDIDDFIDADFFTDREYWLDADIIITPYYYDKNDSRINKFKIGLYSNLDFLYHVSCCGGWELWGKIYKKEVLLNITIPSDRLKAGEDAFVFIQYILNSNTIKVVGDGFYTYKYDENSISNQGDEIYIKHNLISLNYILNYLEGYKLRKVILSNFLILFYLNSFRKKPKSYYLIDFLKLKKFFHFYESFISEISKIKFFAFLILFYFKGAV